MIQSIGLILTLAVIGDTLADVIDVPIPGSAIGLLLLAGVFAARGSPDVGAARVFDAVAPHFPLFFVPAAVGVIANGQLLQYAWIHVAVAIVLGTAVTIAATGLVANAFLRLLSGANTA